MTQRKSISGEAVKVSKSGEVEVAFAQLNVRDSDGDITEPGALPTKDVPMSAYGHTSWFGALPVGKGSISEAGDWAVFKGHFLMETTHGRDAYETVKGLGPLQEWSYGYDVIESERRTIDGEETRILKALDVDEVSPVLKGAGVGTHTLAIKSGAPGSDAPWAERLSWYVDGLKALLDHGKARAEMRASEGRKLSRVDRARLEDLKAALSEHGTTLDELLVEPPDEAEKARLAEALELELGRARSYGVLIPT